MISTMSILIINLKHRLDERHELLIDNCHRDGLLVLQ